MAYRRSLTSRAKLFNQQRFGTSFSYTHHQNDSEKSNSKINNFLQDRSFGNSTVKTLVGFNTFFQVRGLRDSMMNGSFLVRYMSTTIGDGAEKVEYITDVAGVVSDNTVEAVVSQAPAVSEVVVAAADSSYLAGVALIDGIHNFTGLPRWGSIAVATVLVGGLAVPLMIYHLKATSKLTLMRLKLEEIKQERGMSPTAVAEGQQPRSKIFKEYAVTAWPRLIGILIQGLVFVGFFLEIVIMVYKVPSFKEGGAFWLTDLTTPDSLCILPVLTALSFWIAMENNMQEGLEGNPAAVTMKNVSRVFAVLTVPISLSFPKAMFCYLITFNLFSLVYGLVIKAAGVKKFLGVPIIPVAPPSTTAQQPAPSPTEPSKPASIPKHPSKPNKTEEIIMAISICIFIMYILNI